MFSRFSSIVMPAAAKKSKGKSPKRSPSQQSVCDYCPPSVCKEGPCPEPIFSLGGSCPKVVSAGDLRRDCSTDSKKGKKAKPAKGAKGKGKGASPSPSTSPQTYSGNELCSVVIYKWNLCEILLAAVVLTLLVVVVRQACKIMCSSRRRRRRSC